MQLELKIVDSTVSDDSVFSLGAVQVEGDRFMIGRETDCNFRPHSSRVSRHHCIIIRDEYTVRIRDLGSKNGTYVNSRRIHGDVVLNSGDMIRVGELSLQVTLSDEAEEKPGEADTTLNVDTPTDSKSGTEAKNNSAREA